MIQNLRKLALVLDVSGTATPISNTKLYQGGFGFVTLQAYIPVTQNRSPDSMPLCTVHRTTIDSAGNRKQFNLDKYNLILVDTNPLTLNDSEYMLFECPLPKAFTDTVGELEIVINYSEIKDGAVVSRLAANIYRTTVSAGGVSDGDTIDPTGGELARLNDLTIEMEQITDSVENMLNVDDSEANQVGEVSVTITEEGRLKFANLKGENIDPGARESIVELNNKVDATIIISQDAKETANEAKVIAERAEEAVVEGQGGTVVKVNGTAVALFDADTKLDANKGTRLVSDMFLSRITATNPVEIRESQVNPKNATIKSIKGVTTKQLVTNGNFVNAEGWSAGSSTLSVTGNTATVTIGALVVNSGINQFQSVNLVAGHNYYITAQVKAKYTGEIGVSTGQGGSNINIYTTGVANAWTRVSGIGASPVSGASNVVVNHDVSTGGYVIGDTFQIRDVRLYDLTEMGWTTQTKEDCDRTLGAMPYSEGLHSTQLSTLTSVGDNLVNIPNQTVTVNSGIYVDTLLMMEIKVSETYTLTYYTEKISGATPNAIGIGAGLMAYERDIISSPFDSTAGKVKQTVTFTVPADRIGYRLYVRFFRFSSTSTASYRISDVMLQHADNPLTDYKPYTTDVVNIPQYGIKGLPNEVKDEITPTHYVQRTATAFFTNTSNVAMSRSQIKTNSVEFHVFMTVPNGLETSTNTAISSYLKQKAVYAIDEEGFWLFDAGNAIGFRLNKSKLAGYSDSLSDAEIIALCKTFLGINPLTVIYPLAEPIYTPITEWDNHYIAHNYGQESLDDLASIDIEYPLDLVKQVQTDTETIAQLERRTLKARLEGTTLYLER